MSKLDSLEFWKGLATAQRMTGELHLIIDDIAEIAEGGGDFEIDKEIKAAIAIAHKLCPALRRLQDGF